MQPSDLKNLNIAIVGAGYGGAAAATALSLLGATVDVYEQAGRIREVGAGIGLRPSTMDRFRRWGIFDAIADVSSPSDYFEILTATADPIMKEAWPEAGAFGERTRLVHRGDFIEALLGVLPEGMVHLGHKLEGITDEGDRATLAFANGASVTADLVVGADGIRSVVRERLFGGGRPVFAGEHAYRAVIPAADAHGMVVDDNLRMYIGRGTKDDLLKTVEGFDERIVNITRDLDLDTVNCRAVYDIDPVDTWHSDSVVLVGDAAHSMLHHQGQGANSAILDVGALADALAEAGSVGEALARYQAVRKPVTDELQRISRQGWTEDEVHDVFPGQKPASQNPQEV
ncbi:FAD-dependent oxidoreductase [Spirillospora sp. NPDC050679]